MKRLEHEASWRVIKALYEVDDKDSYKKLETAEELHIFAELYNWDDGYVSLNWILDNPKCDLGTSIMIYWRTTPLYYYEKYSSRLELEEEKPSYYKDDDWFGGYDLLKKIESKLNRDDFLSKRIRYSILEDSGFVIDFYEYKKMIDEGKLKQFIPPEALSETPGEIFDYEIDEFLITDFRRQQ